jgi:hypothetical protein
MRKKEIEQEYEKILEEGRASGELADATAGTERRTHPRLKVHSADLWVSTIPEFSMVDMSLSGMAFLSNHPLAPGECINISLGKVMSVDVEVVNCRLEESATDYLDAQFRIQCKFSGEYEGMELLVNACRT